MRNYIQPGEVITLLAPDDVKSGEGVLVGAFFGVAAYDALQGEPVEAKLVGVFELPKQAGAILVGAPVYWHGSSLRSTTLSGAVLVGAATEAAGADAPTVRVRLNGITL